MSPHEFPEAEKVLLDIVKADYDATHRALAGFVTSGGQLRAVGIAAWGVVLAGAIGTHSATIAVVDVPLVIVFAIADGYYSSLYRQTLRRSRDIEHVLREYHNAVGIHGENQRKVARAVAGLEQHRFGVHRDMRPVNDEARWTWWIPRPLRVTSLYLVLIAIAGVVALTVGNDSDAGCQNGRSGRQPCIVLTTRAPARTVTVTTPTKPTLPKPPAPTSPNGGSSVPTSP